MNANKTDLTIILDRSGSMDPIKNDMNGGIAALLKDQAALPGECVVTLVQFDDSVETVYATVPAADAKVDLVPRGGTALYDAVGATIVKTGERLAALPEHERPGKVAVLIVTDGGENASKEYRGQQGLSRIAEMIKHQREAYSWQFDFLGANQDAVLTAKSFNISADDAMTFSTNSRGVSNTYGAVSSKLSSLRSGVSRGYTMQERIESQSS